MNTYAYARISEDGRYRYVLGRRWGEGTTARLVMLNPSTADAREDDPTIRRCIGFAKAWGCEALQVLNLYAFRATDPKRLWLEDDPVGPENDAYLNLAIHGMDSVPEQDHRPPLVVAWGANARADRVSRFMEIAGSSPVMCLGVTKAGAPRHPLYLPKSAEPVRWEG